MKAVRNIGHRANVAADLSENKNRRPTEVLLENLTTLMRFFKRASLAHSPDVSVCDVGDYFTN